MSSTRRLCVSEMAFYLSSVTGSIPDNIWLAAKVGICKIENILLHFLPGSDSFSGNGPFLYKKEVAFFTLTVIGSGLFQWERMLARRSCRAVPYPRRDRITSIRTAKIRKREGIPVAENKL